MPSLPAFSRATGSGTPCVACPAAERANSNASLAAGTLACATAVFPPPESVVSTAAMPAAAQTPSSAHAATTKRMLLLRIRLSSDIRRGSRRRGPSPSRSLYRHESIPGLAMVKRARPPMSYSSRPMGRLRTGVVVVFLLAVPAASAQRPAGEPGLPVAGGKARVVLVGRMVRGTGFHASEHVRVMVLQGRAKRVARQVTVGAPGRSPCAWRRWTDARRPWWSRSATRAAARATASRASTADASRQSCGFAMAR